MSSSKQGGDLYKPIIKEGTHLAQSKKTPSAFCGTQLSDDTNQVDGKTEWVKVEEHMPEEHKAVSGWSSDRLHSHVETVVLITRVEK